jgi:ubiquinone/menaquinone biosynthesis C-methylase UbiE
VNIYEKYCLPHLLNCICNLKVVQEQRKKVVHLAKGQVLEIGMGGGLNIPYYDTDKIDFVWGLEPSEGMRMKAKNNIQNAPFEVRLLGVTSEEIPLDDNSIDSIVLTYTLCTIPDWHTALRQMSRVLKSNGTLIFCEHGAAPTEDVRKWQDRLNPIWNKIAGGCNLNRPIPQLIEQGGFTIQKVESKYNDGPKVASFEYWGTANLC